MVQNISHVVYHRPTMSQDGCDLKRMPFKSFILSLVVVLAFLNSAYGQQTNIHVSMPPSLIDPAQIHVSYIRMHGERIDLNGIDINTTILRETISNTVTKSITLGAALLYGEMNIDTAKRDLSGVVVHGSYNRVLKKPSSELILFMGIPFSYGDFTIENEKDVTVYNFMAGLQGGARLGHKMGDFMTSPWVMVNLMGGYGERYNGGVYYENLNSESIPIFAVISFGLEILYLPDNLTLSGIYQRTFESGDNKPIDTAVIQLGFSF